MGSNSIDGFSLRRRPTASGSGGIDNTSVPGQFLKEGAKAGSALPRRQNVAPASSSGLKRSDIDESLQKFDQVEGKKRRRFRPSKKLFKRIFLFLLVIIVLIGGYLGIKALIAGSNIFGGNLFDILSQAQPLKTDVNGRSNVLIFGTSEDDPHEHGGASLTDSIMLMSIDQKKNQVALSSVPRDLWVDYDTSCEFGNTGKINVVYVCGAGETDLKTHSEAGSQALMKKVGEFYGLDMQYYVHVTYTALQQGVDAVGGVDVTIESSDPRGILDRNFDWECNYKCYYVKYPNGPAHLDGKHALALARARNDAGGYGLSDGNFDREKNQQKIILALRAKAASAGTLANPVATSSLIDSIGNNVKTNFAPGEVKTLIKLAQKVSNKQIDRIDLNDPAHPLLTTGSQGGQSIVRPVAGLYDYSQIQALILKRLTSDAATKEAATVTVLNGTPRPGAASTTKNTLTSKGFNVIDIGNAVASPDYGAVSIYKLSAAKQPATAKKLEKNLGAKVKKGPLPFGMVSNADFVVIVGQ